MIERPKCRRCGVPLDLEWEPADGGETGFWQFGCNAVRDGAGKVLSKYSQDDATFQATWDKLPGDTIARLEREIYGIKSP